MSKRIIARDAIRITNEAAKENEQRCWWDLLDDIYASIHKAATEGKFCTHITFDYYVSSDIIGQIIERLDSDGYYVCFTNCQILTINWKEFRYE